MRNYESMHWHLWEAIRMEADDMYRRGIISKKLRDDAAEVSQMTVHYGVFGTKLRMRACEVEAKLIPFEEEWRKAINQDQEEMHREVEMCERNFGLQQDLPEGSDFRGIGA